MYGSWRTITCAVYPMRPPLVAPTDRFTASGLFTEYSKVSEPPNILVQSQGPSVLSAGGPEYAFHLGDNPPVLFRKSRTQHANCSQSVSIQGALWSIMSMHMSAIAGVPCFPVRLFGWTAGRGFRFALALTFSSSTLFHSSVTPVRPSTACLMVSVNSEQILH